MAKWRVDAVFSQERFTSPGYFLPRFRNEIAVIRDAVSLHGTNQLK